MGKKNKKQKTALPKTWMEFLDDPDATYYPLPYSEAEIAAQGDKEELPASMEIQDEEDNEEDFPEDWEDAYPATGIIDKKDPKEVDIEEKRENTRGRLAIIYTIATFLIFVLGFVVAVIDSVVRGTSIIDGLSVILPLLSGMFLGSLGFVLGYYFRKTEDRY